MQEDLKDTIEDLQSITTASESFSTILISVLEMCKENGKHLTNNELWGIYVIKNLISNSAKENKDKLDKQLFS